MKRKWTKRTKVKREKGKRPTMEDRDVDRVREDLVAETCTDEQETFETHADEKKRECPP